MLTAAERQVVGEAVFLLFSSKVSHRDLIPVIFQAVAPDILPRLPAVPGTDVDAERIISICILDRWRRDPALLELLLQYLVTNQGHGEFAPLLQRVRAKQDPNPSPYEPLWLSSSDRPFIDRSELRASLATLVQQPARPILLVQAPEGSFGRSYSRELIEHVASLSGGTTRAITVELSAGTWPTYGLEDLALDILGQIGVTDGVPEHSDSDQGRAIARFVLGRLISLGAQWIIVLDGFGQDSLKAEVREGIGAMAKLLLTGQYKQAIRLVLVDYTDNQLTSSVGVGNMLLETLRPVAQIADVDVEPAVLEIGRVRVAEGKAALADADVPVVVQRMLSEVPADGKGRLESLNTALSKFRSFAG